METPRIQLMRATVRKALNQSICGSSQYPATYKKMVKTGLGNPGVMERIVAEEAKRMAKNPLNFIIEKFSRLMNPKFDKNIKTAQQESTNLEKLLTEKYDSLYPRTKELRAEICNRIIG